MVAIVAGNGLGLFDALLPIQAREAALGAARLGQAGGLGFVNVVTGNLVLQAHDENLSGCGLDLPHQRTHNAFGTDNDSDSDGWCWSGERVVTVQGIIGQTGSAVIRTGGDGHETKHAWNGSRYTSAEGEGAHDSLAYEPSLQQWLWTEGTTQRVEVYSASTGKLIGEHDSSGHRIAYQYDGSGRLSRVIDSSSGQRLALTYDAISGNLALVRLLRVETQTLETDARGRATGALGRPLKQVDYGYDAAGRLTSVRADLSPSNTADNTVYVTAYAYDGASRRVASVTQSDGTGAWFTYDASARIKTVVDEGGKKTFAYEAVSVEGDEGAAGLRTDVTLMRAGAGTQTWRYYSNSAGRLVGVETPGTTAGERLSRKFRYDADGNLLEATDARGHSVVYEYDGRGNCTRERDALGNTVARAYDDRNQLLTETRYRVPDPDGSGEQSAGEPAVTHFVYDSKARLRFTVSAEGRVGEFRYGTAGTASGLLTHSLRYARSLYRPEGVAGWTEANLKSWSQAQDKSQIQLTEYAYDLRGNLARKTDYSRTDASGAGVLDATTGIIEYIYDGHGALLQTIALRGSARDNYQTMASIVRDGLGRELQVVDGSGTRTTAYADADREIRITAASGLVETRSFDDWGRLTGVVRANGGTNRTTRHVYDDTGRLRMTEDAQGSRRFDFYDAAGRLRHRVDGTGAVTGFEYNANAQIASEIRYSAPASTSGWYDSGTNTVTKDDLILGTDIIADPASDRVVRYEYDAANRPTAFTDPLDFSTETLYDGRSRIVETKTGERTARRFYDGDGRQVGALDPQGYLTEYKFDAAGRTVQTIRYAARSPSAADAAAPAWIGGSIATAISERPFEHYVPAYDADGDGLVYRLSGTAPAWLSLDTSTGVALLKGTPPVGQAQHTVTLVADDQRGKTSETTVRIMVADAPPDAIVANGLIESAKTAAKQAIAKRAKHTRAARTEPSTEDVLVPWRPANTEGLRSYLYYDGQGRVTGAVDERGFLTETLYDEQAHQRRVVKYLNSVAVAPEDTLATLRARAGAAKQSENTEYDQYDRIVRHIAADGSVIRNEYDAAGRAVREETAAGTDERRARRTRYNAFSEITGELSGVGEATLPASPSEAAIDAAIESHGLRHEYDELGRRAKTIDANGNAALFFYDREHRPTHAVNAEREVSETAYDRHGQAISVRRYANRMAKTDYQSLTGGSASQLQGKLPAIDPVNDQLSKFEYDRRGSQVKQTDGEGFITTRTYNEHAQLAKEIRMVAPGRAVATRCEYDLRGDRTSKYADSGGAYHVAQTAYDAFGRQVRAIDTAGKTERIVYKDGGKSIEQTDALGRTTRTEFDLHGRPLKRIDPAGAQTIYRYDDAERSVSVTTPEGVQVKTRKTRHGQILDVTDGRGGVTAYEYDRDGLLTKITDTSGKTVRTNTYGKGGRLLETADALGTTTRIAYDKADRVIERDLGPGILRTSYEFNALGQQVLVVEGVGSGNEKATRHLYDRKGQLKQTIVDPDGLRLSTRYTYDGLGNAIAIEQGTVDEPSQYVVQYAFDDLGRKIKENVAPTSVHGPGTPQSRDIATQYRYDAAGRLSRIVDANGNSTWHVYDASGQRTHAINAEGEVTWTAYDANGREVQVRRYANRLAPEILSRFGDAAYPVVPEASDSDARSYTVYDKDGRARFVLAASLGQDWTVRESRYDANGNVVESRHYDKFLAEGRLKEIETAGTPGVSVAEIVAELAALGYAEDEVSLKNVRRTRSAYDTNNRLRFVVDARGGIIENAYDAAGNLVAKIRYAQTPELSEYTESAIGAAVDRKHPDNRIERFAYDIAGRLRFKARVSAIDGRGTATRHLVSELVYDAHGRELRTIEYANEVGTLPDYAASTLESAVKASTEDRCVAFAYDAAGRQAYRIRVLSPGLQGKHLVARMEHDALGRLVRSIAFSAAMGLADFEKSTLDAAVAANANPKRDRITSYVYDAAGRLRFVVAADRTFSEILYDALGQTVETRRFDAKVPAATPMTEAALAELRGTREVGDLVTRGERRTYDRAGRLLTAMDARKSVESYAYNGLGDRISRTDKNGGVWTYGHDRLGRVFREFSPPAEIMVQLYGESDPSLHEVVLENRFHRDAFGDLIQSIECANSPDARITDYTYDALGRLANTAVHGYYDPAAGKVEKEAGNGRFRREIALAYDAFGSPVRTRTRVGADVYQHEYKTYDGLGRCVHDIDVLGHVTAFAYNAFGEQRAVTRHGIEVGEAPANGNHWNAAELAARLGADAAARTIVTAYDNAGRKLEVKQPAVAHYHGDDLLRKNAAAVSLATDQAATRYEYNAFGDLRCESTRLDADRWQRHWRYFDAMGREILGIDALNHHTARGYDAFGNLVKTVEYAEPGSPGSADENAVPQAVENTKDRITGFTYDPLNKQTKVERFGLHYSRWDGNAYIEVHSPRDTAAMVQKTTYDRNGNVVAKADGGGGAWQYVYNALGQLVKITEPMRIAAKRATIDPFSSPLLTTPVVSMTLNAFGNVLSQTRSPENGFGEALTTQQSVDAAGNIVVATDAKGNPIVRKFDHAGRVLSEKRNGGVSLGDWTSNSHTIERRYAYDASGRQTHVLDVYQAGGAAVQSGLRSIFNAAGEVVETRRVWGPADAALDSLAGAVTASYAYDSSGHVVTAVTAGGRSKHYYNFAGKATRQEQLSSDGAVARIVETGYDGLGRATVQRLAVFDARLDDGSLRSITPLIQQVYDRWGNVVRLTQGGYVINESGAVAGGRIATTTYEYNADNRPTIERQPAAAAWKEDGTHYSAVASHTIRYDLVGRAVQELDLADDAGTPADEARVLRLRTRHYDISGQLLKHTDATGIATQYAYDAHGNRIGTRDALGKTRVDVFDKNNNLMAHGILRYAAGNPVPRLRKLRLYLYDPANRRVGEADVMDDAGTIMHWSFAKLDERGLVGAHRNASHAVTVYTYDQFGNRTSERDANGKGQDWGYSEALDDYSAGRLVSSTVAGNRTTYAYDAFGQVIFETQPGEGNNRGYEYHANGLLKTVVDRSAFGTQGMEGGADYWTSADVMRYEYSPEGRVVKEAFERTGTQELGLYDNEGNLYEVYNASIDPVHRVVRTDYDERGRIHAVRVPAAENPGRGRVDLEHRYDELGNRRNIRANYVLPDSTLEQASDKWYLYDAEGRMTLIDGELKDGQIKQGFGTSIAYDAAGRRRAVDKFASGEYETSYDPETNESVTYAWNEYHLEDYAYDDLNFLASVHRAVAERNRTVQYNNGPLEPMPDEQRARLLVETRSYDVRGGLVSHLREDPSTQTPKTTTTSVYRGDGQLSEQNIVYSNMPERNAWIGNGHDAAGVLRTYTYHQGAGTEEEFTNIYAYQYAEEFGGYKEKQIAVESTRPGLGDGVTTNRYDRKGRLLSQSTVNPSEYRNRSFLYGIDDRIVSKSELAKSGDSPAKTGKQDYSYAQGRQVAVLGSGTLRAAQFSNGYTPISPSYPGPSAGNHVVATGDTLADIAQVWFGDSALSHLIAEANNVSYAATEALPSTEVGKVYRIPNVVGNVHNDADTFLPYSAANLIGDGTPWPGVLPVPEPSLAEAVLATAAVTAVAIAVTVYTSGVAAPALGPVLGAGIGAAAGNAAGQAVGIALKHQSGFSSRQLLAAGLMGSAASAAGGALNNPLARITHGFIFGQAINRATGLQQGGFGNSLVGLGTQLAIAGVLGSTLDKLRTGYFAWGEAIEDFAGDALNLQSGWAFNNRTRTWTNIVSQATGAFTSVATAGAVGHLREWGASKRKFRTSYLYAKFEGSGGGSGAPTIEERAKEAEDYVQMGYDAIAGEVVVYEATALDGEIVQERKIRMHGEELAVDGIIPSEVFWLVDKKTPVERTRLAGTTNIVPEDKYIRNQLGLLGISERAASDAVKKQLRWTYHKLYRPVKAAEYEMQMHRIDVANATVNRGLGYLTQGAGYATGIGTLGLWGAAKEYVYSEAGERLAKVAGLGPELQFVYGLVGGGLAVPSTLPTYGHLVPDNFSLRTNPITDDAAFATSITNKIAEVPEMNLRFSPAADHSHVASGTVSTTRIKPQPGVSYEEKVIVQLSFELFGTMDDAARAALRESNQNSIREIAEWGGMIYRAPDGRFGYTGPVEGGPKMVELSSAMPSPGIGTRVGDYHTHSDYHVMDGNRVVRTTRDKMPTDPDVFSENDIWLTWQAAQHTGVPYYTGYLATPSGKGFFLVPGERINQYTIRPFSF